MWQSYNARFFAALAIIALLLIPTGVAGGPAKSDSNIFDLLMPGQEPDSVYSETDPSPGLRAMLEPMMSVVRKVEVLSYSVKSDATDEEILKGFETTLTRQAWERRVIQRPGRGFDAVFSHDRKDGLMEFMLIEIRGKNAKREASFTRIIGEKDNGVSVPLTPLSRKEAPPSINGLRITAAGPSLQYEAWAKDIVEVQKLQPTGQFSMPDIITEGSGMRIDLPLSQQMQQFRMGSALDYSIKGPQRFTVKIESTGSPVTVKMNGIKQLSVNAANAPVAILGLPSDGTHIIEVVNQKVVLNLEPLQSGEIKVNATNAEITATLPNSSNVEISANAVAGTVRLESPGWTPKTENPFKMTLGTGAAKLFLESVSGKITINLK
ncbi:MAG: hypothetical protein Q7N50_05725 [Armatimonadota bacterium]|nr:hypothetical protein [Armatimonadota bacterium]